jgi:hypothetical protein
MEEGMAVLTVTAPCLAAQVRANLPPGVDGWGISLNGLMGMVVIGGLIITAIYWALQRKVVPQIKTLREKKKKQKAKMSVGESFAFLAASPYIRDLATLVVAYGISINLVEVTWKSKIKAQVGDAAGPQGLWLSAAGGCLCSISGTHPGRQLHPYDLIGGSTEGSCWSWAQQHHAHCSSFCSSPTPTTTLPSWASSPPPLVSSPSQ